jgi:hypothetical protein
MRLHIGILVVAITASMAWAQMPILDNTRKQLKVTEKNLPQNALKDVNTAQKPAGTPAHSATPVTSSKGAVSSTPKPAAKPVKATKTYKKAVLASAPQPKPETKSEQGTKGENTPATAQAGANKKDANDGADLPASLAEVSKKFVAPRRDPFVSPVVTHIENTGCTTGKRCLTPGQISLKGVVRSENGMIAVVVNSMNKAYFLRENDPIFNGYVLRITGDSIVFMENFQDNLGKPRTREVVKRISTPAV